MLDSLEVTWGGGDEVRASVIWLHGLGADGHDFEPIVPELRLPRTAAVRFVFPHAPVRPVTLNNGMRMRAWYDLYNLDEHGRADEQGLRASAAAVEALLAREVERGVASERIVLAGFSQGGALALHAGLRHATRLAGIMALSAYLPRAAQLGAELQPANAATPVFVAHGRLDPVLAFAAGERARDQLQALGLPVTWKAYPMPHSVCPDEITDIAEFLRRVLVL